MKKILLFLLIMLMCFGVLVACNSPEDDIDNSESTNSSDTTSGDLGGGDSSNAGNGNQGGEVILGGGVDFGEPGSPEIGNNDELWTPNH